MAYLVAHLAFVFIQLWWSTLHWNFNGKCNRECALNEFKQYTSSTLDQVLLSLSKIANSQILLRFFTKVEIKAKTKQLSSKTKSACFSCWNNFFTNFNKIRKGYDVWTCWRQWTCWRRHCIISTNKLHFAYFLNKLWGHLLYNVYILL